jgi:GTPase SAR1 family protein
MSQKELKIEVMPAEKKPKDRRIDKINFKDLPKIPANILLLGRCGSGKSSILYSLLTKGFTYGPKHKSLFDEAVFYIGTLDAKHIFEKLPIKNSLVLEEFDPMDFSNYLDDLRTHQLEKLEKKKPPMNTLICFDDFVGAALMKRINNKPSPLEKLVLTSRHEANATIMFCSQVYRNSGFSNPTVRNNLTTIILAQMSRIELEKISEEYSGDMTKDEFITIYDRIMAKRPYNFMVMDSRRPLNARWTEQFSIPIPRPRRLQELDATAEKEKVEVESSDSDSSDSSGSSESE